MLGALDTAILRAWRTFKSLRFGLFLLGLIGVACIYGTMGYASNAALGNHQIPLARAKVFNAPWFAALLAVFAVQLVVSTWHVTLLAFRIWGRKEFKRSAASFAPAVTRGPRAEVRLPEGTDIAAVEAALRRGFTRFHREGGALFAHRGLLSRVGPTVVHAGMIMILAAGMVRYVLVTNGTVMSEGRFIAAEGETSNIVWEPRDHSQSIGGSNVQPREIPNKKYIRVLDFDEVKHANVNSPAYFSSLVEITDPLTNRVSVHQLDMNHSVNIDGLQFHQAGYEAIAEERPTRFLFDVRNPQTGKRIAVTDASARVPVRIGETDWHLIVDGTAPGARWQIFHRDQPTVILAKGRVDGGATGGEFTYEVVRFFPNFQIDREAMQPFNANNDPANPAAELVMYLNGQPIATQWIFFDPQIQSQNPPRDSVYAFELRDVLVPSGQAPDADLTQPGAARFVLAAIDRTSGKTAREDSLTLGERSAPLPYKMEQPPAAAPEPGAQFAVTNLGPTTRYTTVLSVVNEPTVPATVLGVAVIFLGALMTFISRYEALYGLLSADGRTLQLALVPRWGRGYENAAEALEGILARLTALGAQCRLLDRNEAYETAAPAEESNPDEPAIAEPQVLTHA